MAIELDKSIVKSNQDNEENKRRVTDWMETIEKKLDVITELLHAIARAQLHQITNNKEETERWDTEKELRANVQPYQERKHSVRAKSNDINEVIELWAKECGENNRWVKALRGFRDAGGTMRWYSGYPHPGQFKHFTLFDPDGKELIGYTLNEIKEYARKFMMQRRGVRL